MHRTKSRINRAMQKTKVYNAENEQTEGTKKVSTEGKIQLKIWKG